MNDEPRSRETEATLEIEKADLERQVRRFAMRRTQLLVMLLPFVIALGWTGYNFYVTLFEVLRAAETNLKALFEMGFWGVISILVVYVVAIVYRERASTAERESQAEKRLVRVVRRLQQKVLAAASAEAAAGPEPLPPAVAPVGAPPHAQGHPVYPPTAAPAAHPRPTSARPSAPPRDKGPIVLDLDADDTKECPMCAEKVRARAKVCRFCRHEFEPLTGGK